MLIVLTKEVISRIQLGAERAVEFLKKYSTQVGEIAKNLEFSYAYLYCLLVLSQAILTMANYLIVKLGLKIPRSFREALEILIDEDVIPKDFEPQAKAIIEIRDMILHYWNESAHDVIYSITKDFSSIEEIYNLVKNQVNKVLEKE
ncbi:MAG: HepT-like ribonuclease domain-containing protein [Candidatus Korarchaeota archaeon]|nr:DUF86 domain-containing protein [Thermoproteota archaeon]MCR8463385.1 DUF86 domain-containing protein [Thermoproteota archaeon]MCR8470428.1 DUF86 domain-containing protein [Thermoproteota archaeon]MCR8471445.1 DUF86 domain-containing protein [Thermoproteota archaeon]MCR8473288.1 DUF86 domain-containing protein [Thermoproteota archaeon]